LKDGDRGYVCRLQLLPFDDAPKAMVAKARNRDSYRLIAGYPPT
jgi:hypothetical protein